MNGVTFTITDETGTETVLEATECTALMQYTHSYLGFATERTAADTLGYACVTANMDQGITMSKQSLTCWESTTRIA